MFHRGGYGRGQARGSGLRGGRAGLTGHAGSDGGGRPEAQAWSGRKHRQAWNQLCDSLDVGAVTVHDKRSTVEIMLMSIIGNEAPSVGTLSCGFLPNFSRPPEGLSQI